MQHVKQNKDTQEICEVIIGKSKSKEGTQNTHTHTHTHIYIYIYIYIYFVREIRLTPFIFLRYFI